MKTTSLLSLLLAVATAVSAIPMDVDAADVMERSSDDLDTTDFESFDSGSFDLEERAGAHIVLHNALSKTLSYQLNDGGARKTLGKGKTVHLPYPALNAPGYKIYLSHPGSNNFFLAEYALGNGDGGGNKVSYNFSKAGAAVDPFKAYPKSFVPLSNKNKPGYNCIPIHCAKGGKDRCAAMNGERIIEDRSNGRFPVGSCPASTSLKVTIG